MVVPGRVLVDVQGYLVYKKTLLKKTHRIRPLRFLIAKKIGPTGFSSVFLFLRKHRPTGLCVCQEKKWAPYRLPPWRMELANSRAEKYANISREKWVFDWCTFEKENKNVIFGHLQGGSCVCTLLVYL